MNQTFSVALNQPAGQRDFSAYWDDDYTLTLRVYATDSPDDTVPLDLTGAILVFKVAQYPYSSNVVVSGQDGVFSFEGPFRGCGAREEYTIELTLAGDTTTVAYGTVVVAPRGEQYGYGCGPWGRYSTGAFIGPLQLLVDQAKVASDEAMAAAEILGPAAAEAVASAEIATNAAASATETIAALSLPNGASLIGSLQAGPGSVPRTLQSRVLDLVSIKDKGAVINGVTDDGAAITAARAVAFPAGGSVLYGGRTKAADFWANRSPLAQEWGKGLPTAYATDMDAGKPVIGGFMFNGTPATKLGYDAYFQRFDGVTQAGVDVASSVVGFYSMQSYSTNSTGNAFNKTNQVALVANASAMTATASASVEAFNAIAASAYIGPLSQMVVGIEADVSASNPPGWFGTAATAYTVAFSAVLQGIAADDATVAFSSNSSSATKTFWHGAVLAGSSKTGVTVARNGTFRPESGVWVSAATTFGVYVGAKAKHALNPGSASDYTYRPSIGIGLGQEGATSAASHKVRFISTDAASAEVNTDVYAGVGGNFRIDFGGTNRFFVASANGYVFIQGTQVLATRNVGWGVNSGTTSKAAFDTATVTLPALAQNVAALHQALRNHGLIGD